MILQALVRHYENLAAQEKVSREGWCQAKVSYGINLSKEGEITGIISLKQEKERGKKKVPVPALRMVPEMVTRSSGVSANFLCDNSKYLLGIDAQGTGKRISECFQAARKRHLELLEGAESDMARAVRLFFEKWEPQRAEACSAVKENWEDITDGGNLIFCMGMEEAQADSAVQEAWEKARGGLGMARRGSVWLRESGPRFPEFTGQSRGCREPSPAERRWFPSMLLHLNPMVRNRAIMRRLENTRSLPIRRR